MRVLIVHDRVPEEGANPDQTDVLVQAEAIGRSLSELGHQYSVLPLSMDLRSFMDILKDWGPDLVFNLVESVEGAGRLLHLAPSVFDLLRMPYTGSPTEALFLTSNKLLAKKLMTGAGVPTPEYLTMEEVRRLGSPLNDPYIIKSVWEHASLGIGDDSVITGKDPRLLIREMEIFQEKLGGTCFVERFVNGREFNISLLAEDHGPRVLPAAEIQFHDYPAGKVKIVGYKAKWDQDSFEYHNTRRVFDFNGGDEPLINKLSEVALECWNLFGLRGYGRVDFRVDREDRPWVLEINTNPCLSPDAGFAAAASRAGLDFKEMVRRVINDSAITPLSRG